MIRALPPESYRVEAVGDEQAALAAIKREAPQVIVFSAPAKGAADLARRLKGNDASGEAYLLAIMEAPPPPGKELSNLTTAGVHDFMRRPVLDTEFLERIKAPARLVRWVRSIAKPAAFDFSEKFDVTQLRAWRDLPALAAEDLSQLAGQPFTVSGGWPKRFGHGVKRATIPLSLVEERLELRISIAIDPITLRWLREAVLGDPTANDAATDDALREFANTAGGAVKRAALCENIVLTTGLPVNDQATRAPEQNHCWTLTPEGGDACIAIVGQIIERSNQRIPASQLVEGMILTHDLRSEGGILRAPAGSRLTSTTAARLAQMLGPRFYLEVAPAA